MFSYVVVQAVVVCTSEEAEVTAPFQHPEDNAAPQTSDSNDLLAACEGLLKQQQSVLGSLRQLKNRTPSQDGPMLMTLKNIHYTLKHALHELTRYNSSIQASSAESNPRHLPQCPSANPQPFSKPKQPQRKRRMEPAQLGGLQPYTKKKKERKASNTKLMDRLKRDLDNAMATQEPSTGKLAAPSQQASTRAAESIAHTATQVHIQATNVYHVSNFWNGQNLIKTTTADQSMASAAAERQRVNNVLGGQHVTTYPNTVVPLLTDTAVAGHTLGCVYVGQNAPTPAHTAAPAVMTGAEAGQKLDSAQACHHAPQRGPTPVRTATPAVMTSAEAGQKLGSVLAGQDVTIPAIPLLWLG
jgi:hypothetical protein